jgi:RNA polymerase sigma-70 factor (ECF subfamily)
LKDDAREKIEDLFRRCGAGVGSYVLVRVGDPELAEEITARVFLTAVRHAHQQNGSAVGWLWSIVRSELARLARERPHQSYPAELTSNEALPDELLERKELAQSLHLALEQLPEAERQIITFKFFLGLGNQEIADATGMTANHVGVKLHRALKELRNHLERVSHERTN